MWSKFDFNEFHRCVLKEIKSEKINGVGLTKDGIDLYSKDDFLGMHKAGRLAAQILDEIGEFVYPGQATSEIDKIIEDKVNQLGAKSATIGYKGYEHASCISTNHVVCHGIPSDKKLKDGDILNIDVTVIYDGWYGDTSRMFVAGNLTRKAERLIQITHDALYKGIDTVKPGATFGDIGHAIQDFVEKKPDVCCKRFLWTWIRSSFSCPSKCFTLW